MGLNVSDTMFSTNGSAKFHCNLERFAYRGSGTTNRVRVIAIAHIINVNISVAGVAKINDKGLIAFAD